MSKVAKMLGGLVQEIEHQMRKCRADLVIVEKNWGPASGQAQYIVGKLEAFKFVLKYMVNQGKKLNETNDQIQTS